MSEELHQTSSVNVACPLSLTAAVAQVVPRLARCVYALSYALRGRAEFLVGGAREGFAADHTRILIAKFVFQFYEEIFRGRCVSVRFVFPRFVSVRFVRNRVLRLKLRWPIPAQDLV